MWYSIILWIIRLNSYSCKKKKSSQGNGLFEQRLYILYMVDKKSSDAERLVPENHLSAEPSEL